jgi:murein DD-endopeptidase MepM/ murein hydrolase activator NlpD
MKKISLLFLLVFFTTYLLAQKETPAYKLVADRFQKFYNSSAYDSIFSLFSPEMKAALPLDKSAEFFGGLKVEAGLITQKEFIKQENSYVLYKTHFERALYGIHISLDDHSYINGFFVKPFKPDSLPKPERNLCKLMLPFKGSWFVVWGVDTKEQNYHVVSEAQKNAFDILIHDKDGKSYSGDGSRNEDYYAFGKELMAPCDAEVVSVVDGVKENIPGEMNSFDVGGNTVILKTLTGEYLVFCHMKHHSIQVKEGDKVKQGQLLGLCGNSGHSSEAHLHFHIQNVEDFNKATGIKCYFDQLEVNGKLKQDYSPVKGDVVENK